MIRPTSAQVHVTRIEEVFRPGNPGYWVHPEWEARFPWLMQGTTGRGEGEGGLVWDFALLTDPPASGAQEVWDGLRAHLGFPRVEHSLQIHGKDVLVHRGEASVLHRDTSADGHVTGKEGILLGVTVADCVPVFLVDPTRRAVGVLHAGWRGYVAGILERGIQVLGAEFGTVPEDLFLHVGPAICGDCYEVGPEVHSAMGLSEPAGPSPVDLRALLASRAFEMGVDLSRITESAWCTLCEGSPFFSHRRAEMGRQVGFLGILPAEGRRHEGRGMGS